MSTFQIYKKVGIVLTNYYVTHGIDRTIQIAQTMLELPELHTETNNFGRTIQGEIAELVCYLQIHDFIKKNNLEKWSVHKGLFITSMDTDKDHITEIDITLVTPNQIVLFEVKSYSGSKKIVDSCTVKTSRTSWDVFNQHIKHYETFSIMFEVFKDKGVFMNQALLPVVYLFSKGPYTDQREDSKKTQMPLYDSSNLNNLLEIVANSEKVWDVDSMQEALGIIEKSKRKMRGRHKAYVKKLHGNYTDA